MMITYTILTITYITTYTNDIYIWKDERFGRIIRSQGLNNLINCINPSECVLFVGLTYADFEV